MSLLGFAKKLNITLTWKFHEQEQNILIPINTICFTYPPLNICLFKIVLGLLQCKIFVVLVMQFTEVHT